MTEYGRCPAFGYECEYVAKVEAQAAEIEAYRRSLYLKQTLISDQAAEIERLKAEVKNAWCDDALPCRQLMDAKQEIERLRGALLWIRRVCAEELDLEYNDAMRRVFQRNVRDAALKALTHPEAGQPWLRTYDAHLKGEGE